MINNVRGRTGEESVLKKNVIDAADIFEDSLNVGDIAMTVLDENIMSNSLGGDRYITPEYLAPLPQVIFF